MKPLSILLSTGGFSPISGIIAIGIVYLVMVLGGKFVKNNISSGVGKVIIGFGYIFIVFGIIALIGTSFSN